MKLLKKIRKYPQARAFIAFFITQYVRFVWLTTQWKFIGKENPDPYWENNTAIIGCFWHGRLLMMLKAWLSPREVFMLSSSHADGEIMQRIIKNFGYKTIVGSSSRGGKSAVLSMIRALKEKKSIGITPDGPRGPRYQASASIIQMARLGDAVVFPVSYSSTRGKFMRSWDRFFLPFPFGKGVIMYGKPIEVVGSSKSDEELRQELENALKELTRQADIQCGHGDLEALSARVT